MKLYSNLIFFVSITVLTLVGCNHETDTISPVSVLNPDTPLDSSRVSLFRLPTPALGGISNLSESLLVSPDTETVFHAKLSYTTIDGKSFVADAKFTVPRGALSDTVTITVSLDTVHAAIQFKPDGLQFRKPASVDISLKNLDPFATAAIVKFMYANPNGTYTPQEFEQLKVTGDEGKITLKNGKINHFSRYVFGRRHGSESFE